MHDVAVIGAGPAGLACARAVAAGGGRVVVLDKARGPGGRLATRRSDAGRFDHGAQVLTHDAAAVLQELAPGGLAVRPWAGGVVPVPRMSAAGRALAHGLDVRTAVRVTALVRDDDGWVLHDEAGDAVARAAHVAVCAPAPQAAALLAGADPDLAARAGEAAYDPCWAVLAAWEAPTALPDVVAAAGPVDWAARQSAVPGREAGERFVVQATATWSADRLEDAGEAIARDLLEGLGAPAPAFVTAHRWRYARVRHALDVPCLLGDDGLGAAGDWCAGEGVGPALASGRALGAALACSLATAT